MRKLTLVLVEIFNVILCIYCLDLGQDFGIHCPNNTITYIIPFAPGGQSQFTALTQKSALEALTNGTATFQLLFITEGNGDLAW